MVFEVCEGANFAKSSTLGTNCKNIVRLTYQGYQKKTKVNVNSRNPKFYELFQFNLKDIGNPNDIGIQIINIEQGGEWVLIG